MREIKFRGKRLDNGEWVYGYLYRNELNSFILIELCLEKIPNSQGIQIGGMVEVDPNTVGQWTGYKDRVGNEVYEDDIVRGDFGIYNLGVVAYHTEAWKDFRTMGAYVVEHKVIDTNLDSDGVDMSLIVNQGKWGKCADLEVHSNIHDNPELLEQIG